jgi:hypothetical protein
MSSPPLRARGIREFWRSSAPPAAIVLFFAFVTAGAAFIVFAKLSLLSNFFVALVPVLIMVAYAASALFDRAVRLRDDQTGDNLYYMGFLFTLTSLAVALYQFGDETGFDEIVRNFGVAISSTITGIALRVMFNQMRQDPIEVEHAARQELAEAARQVRTQLNETVLAFNHFRTQTIQSLQEVQEEMRKRLAAEGEEAAARAAKPLEQAAARTGAVLEKFATAMSEKLDKSASQLGDETAKIAKSIADIEGALVSFHDRLASMQTPDRLIEIKLEPVIGALTAAVAEVGRQSEIHATALKDAAGALARKRAPRTRSRWLFWRR